MSEFIDVITRLGYIADDQGLKQTSQFILKQTSEIEQLLRRKIALGEKQKQIAVADIASQEKIFREIKKVDDAIRAKSKSVINERIASQGLNKELEKEIGLLANIEQKMNALQTKKAMAQTASDVRAVNKEIRGLENQMRSLQGGPSGPGILGQLFGGFAIGGGVGVILTAIGALKSLYSESTKEFEDAKKTALDLERALKVIGKGRYFDDLIAEADQLQKKYNGLYDNDDIIKAQTALVQYGRVSKESLSKLLPVVIELAAAQRIDLVQAADKVVEILRGRGAATLGEYGLKVRGLKTDQERLNVVLGEFASKLTGASDAFAQTADGIEQANDVLAKNLEERLGEYTSKLNILFKQTLLGFFQFVDDMTTTAAGARDKAFKDYRSESSDFAKSLSDKDLQDQVRMLKFNAKEIDRIKNNIADMEISRDNLPGRGGISEDPRRVAFNESIKAEQERFDKMLAKNSEIYREYLKRRNKAYAAEDKKNLNANAVDDPIEKKEGKTAEQLAEEARKKQEALFQKQLKDIDARNEKELLAFEKLKQTEGITDEDFKDLSMAREIAYLDEIISLYEKFNRDSYKLQADKLRKEEALRDRYRDRARAKAKAEGPVTGEFLPGSQGDVEVPNASALNTKEFTKERNDELEAAEENFNKIRDHVAKASDDFKTKHDDQTQNIIDNFSAINDVVQAVGGALDTALQKSIDHIDREIGAQEKRIERAKRYAERGGAELLEIEEERLAKIEERREKFARRQIIVNDALALSNAILAVATAAGETGVGAIAAVPAVIAAIAAGYALVTDLTDEPGFKEGTKSVQGPGSTKSDSIRVRVSKEERIVDADRSARFKNIMDDIQDDKFKSEADLISKIRAGEYGGMNYGSAISAHHEAVGTASDRVMLQRINSSLEGVREAIEDKPVGSIYADENGFNLYYSRMARKRAKQDKYA